MKQLLTCAIGNKGFLFALAMIFSILASGCGSLTTSTPPQEDRLSGLIENSQLKSGPNQLLNTANIKLAIVSSVNVEKSLKANRDLESNFNSPLWSMATSGATSTVADDAAIIMSSSKLLDGLLIPIKKRFSSVFFARDLREAFAQGADVVGILDLRLEMNHHPDPSYKKLNFTHVANASMLLINRKLEAGPDLVSNITHLQSSTPSGADANVREMLVNMRMARVKLLQGLESEAALKLK